MCVCVTSIINKNLCCKPHTHSAEECEHSNVRAGNGRRKSTNVIVKYWKLIKL